MASDKVMHVTDAAFQAEVLDSDVPVIVDFWAPWCAPCRAIAPILESLAETYEGKLKVVKVNVDENTGIAQQHRITAIPTVLLIKGGAVVDNATGAKSKDFFKKMVEAHI